MPGICITTKKGVFVFKKKFTDLSIIKFAIGKIYGWETMPLISKFAFNWGAMYTIFGNFQISYGYVWIDRNGSATPTLSNVSTKNIVAGND